MASVTPITLMDAESLAVATTPSGAKSAEPRQTDFIATLDVTNGVGATVDVTMQHSFDNGGTWHDWFTIPSQVGNGQQLAFATDPALSRVRAEVQVAGATADVTVKLWYDKT